jgi:hypothetical protein
MTSLRAAMARALSCRAVGLIINWSGLSSRANPIRNLLAVTVPNALGGAMADQTIFVADPHAELQAYESVPLHRGGP